MVFLGSSSESYIDSEFLTSSALVYWRSCGGSVFPRNSVRSRSLCLFDSEDPMHHCLSRGAVHDDPDVNAVGPNGDLFKAGQMVMEGEAELRRLLDIDDVPDDQGSQRPKSFSEKCRRLNSILFEPMRHSSIIKPPLKRGGIAGFASNEQAMNAPPNKSNSHNEQSDRHKLPPYTQPTTETSRRVNNRLTKLNCFCF